MKKNFYLILMLAVLVMVCGSSAYAQALTQMTDPSYVCGYYYQNGQRMTDCFDQNGVYIPAEPQLDDQGAGAYESYRVDSAERAYGFDMMGDFTDDYDGEMVYGDPDGVHFVQQSDYFIRIGNYEASVSIPAVKGMADAAAEKGLNEYIRSVAYGIIDQFEVDARSVLSESSDLDELPHFMTAFDFFIETNSESILTLAIEYTSISGSSYISTSYFNFNKATRELIYMDDYFIPGTSAAEILKSEIQRQMRAQAAANPDLIYWIDENEGGIELNWDDLLASIGNNNGYYIDENGDLTIAFAKYDVAPGAMGNPKFVIPTDVVAAMDAALVQP